jgi:ubiquinone/menaquinone biosynthesis C-methylase UbiE
VTLDRPTRPGRYAEQAKTYDLTRGASPTVVRALSAFLGPPDGRLLLDVAGGTGNYAQVLAARGFRVLVMDAEPAMLEHAARKLGAGHVVAADAEALPLADRSVDCAVMVNAVHLLAAPLGAFREIRRVIRQGPFCFTGFARENLAALFVYGYFGLDHPPTRRPAIAEFEALLADAGFMKVTHERYVYTDTVDGSLNALHTNALHLAGPAYLRNTSFWHALDDQTRQRGLEALARDLRSGVLEERVRESYKLAAEHGHGTLFAAWP